MSTMELVSRCLAQEKHMHTKDNDSYVYRAKSTEFIRILEKAILVLVDEADKERLKTTYGRCGLR